MSLMGSVALICALTLASATTLAAQDTLTVGDRVRVVTDDRQVVGKLDAINRVLFPRVVTHFVHRRIRGLSSPYRTDPVWYMEELWIEDER